MFNQRLCESESSLKNLTVLANLYDVLKSLEELFTNPIETEEVANMCERIFETF